MPDADRFRAGLGSWLKIQEYEMPVCEVCGNDYDKAFQVIRDGEAHTFDSRGA
jgi:hypothetical protein